MEGHTPVLKKEIVEAFKHLQGNVLDGTFGGGGHSEALLESNPSLCITALDIDPEAQERSQLLLEKFPHRFTFQAINFSQINTLRQSFQGVLLDLGVSSFQLDDAKRGFSFRKDGPLDMRMNPNAGIPASDFLRTATENQLIQAIRDYGEEPQWRSVIKSILQHRDSTYWESTTEFVRFLETTTSIARSKKIGIHPATRVFQGLRIAINDELCHLDIGLKAAFKSLTSNGILAVISFHSLEDRIVKQNFYTWCGRSLNRYDSQPRQLKTIQAELLHRKPITADDSETKSNPRARSAKLRILKKL